MYKMNINYVEIEKFRAVVVLRFLESESNDGDDDDDVDEGALAHDDRQQNFVWQFTIPFHLIYMQYTCD